MSNDAHRIQLVPLDELAELFADPRAAALADKILRLGRYSRVHLHLPLPEPAPRLGDYATAEEFLAAHNGPRDPEPRPAAAPRAPLALTAGAGAPAEAPDLTRSPDEIERTDPR
jgi:hypothetical protein